MFAFITFFFFFFFFFLRKGVACAARAASQVAMGSIDDVRLAVQFATGVSILSREKKTALLKVKG